MALLLVALAYAQPTPVSHEPEPPEASAEMVVIAERMRHIVTSLHGPPGARICRIDRSSGDPMLDGLVCERVYLCARMVSLRRREMSACATSGIPEILRRRSAMAQ